MNYFAIGFAYGAFWIPLLVACAMMKRSANVCFDD